MNNTLYTGDWTTQRIYKHALTPKGAIYEPTQEEFISLLRPADLALDGNSNLYVASLAGGQFTYNSDTVGYVVRVRPSSATRRRASRTCSRRPTPRCSAQLASPNAVHRIHAQQELVRRGAKPAVVARAAPHDRRRASSRADARAAAIFTLKQLQGAEGERRARAAPRAPPTRACARPRSARSPIAPTSCRASRRRCT